MKSSFGSVVLLTSALITNSAFAYDTQIDVQLKGNDRLGKSSDGYYIFEMKNGQSLWAYCSGKDEMYAVTWTADRKFIFITYGDQISEGYFMLNGCERGQANALETLLKKLTPGQFNRVKFDRSTDVVIGQ